MAKMFEVKMTSGSRVTAKMAHRVDGEQDVGLSRRAARS